MIDNLGIFSDQLKEACRLTGSRWAVWLRREGQHWDLLAEVSLRKAQRAALMALIRQPEAGTWLAGALSSGRVRFRSTGAFAALNCARVYAFPNAKEPLLILVGADQIDPTAQSFFRILALQPYPGSTTPGSVENRHQPDPVKLEAYTYPEQALEHVLNHLVKQFPCEAAYLTVRYGDFLRIERVWQASPKALGLDIPILEDELLAGMVENRRGVVLGDVRKDIKFERVTAAIDRPVKSCLQVPFVIGRRVIGAVVLLSSRLSRFSKADLERGMVEMERLSPAFENAITFQEVTRYLQRFALLNEIASSASIKIGAGETAQVVIKQLQTIFRTEHVSLLLRSDGDTGLRNYGKPEVESEDTAQRARINLAGQVVETGLPLRIGDINAEPGYPPVQQGVQAALVVPLKYLGEVIGAISLESEHRNAFTEADQQLLVMIANQLAGLFENARLNLETQERYRELQERIEAQHLAESQLIRSARLAAVGEMAARMAHELNNPLTAIIGFVELALNELPNDDTLKPDLELVLSEAMRARSVLRHLLDFSRQNENIRQRAEINNLVADSLALVQQLLGSNCIQVFLDLPQDLPEIYVDPDQIKQVLLNLIHNAVQAMPDGGNLRIQTCTLPNPEHPKTRGVSFSIIDTGEGISAENQQHLFEPFFTTRPIGEGTGLGLAVSYGIVTAHKGVIFVESEIGQGSCFTVWLPIMELLAHE
jgi:signal transduction histidine kinase